MCFQPCPPLSTLCWKGASGAEACRAGAEKPCTLQPPAKPPLFPHCVLYFDVILAIYSPHRMSLISFCTRSVSPLGTSVLIIFVFLAFSRDLGDVARAQLCALNYIIIMRQSYVYTHKPSSPRFQGTNGSRLGFHKETCRDSCNSSPS